MSGYFYGWYLKCQSDTQTLAVIPAIHGAGRERTCSIQFITEEDAWTVTFPGEMFHLKKDNRDSIVIGKNRFSKDGIYLDVNTSELKISGKIKFASLTPLKYDIMGPFTLVPFMECRHSVYSMMHRVDGKLSINGKEYVFENALGYWEGDRGRSFPKQYAWTQCFISDKKWTVDNAHRLQSSGSIMLSVADIPVAGLHFTGIIGIVHWKDKEHRFATYLGARVLQKENGMLLIRQGKMELEVRLLEKNAHSLQAPTNGAMIRTIRENVKCKAFYRLRENGQTIFAAETNQASFEFEYN